MQKKCRENTWKITLNQEYEFFFQIQTTFFPNRNTKIVILKTAIQTDQLTGEPYCFIKGLLYK